MRGEKRGGVGGKQQQGAAALRVRGEDAERAGRKDTKGGRGRRLKEREREGVKRVKEREKEREIERKRERKWGRKESTRGCIGSDEREEVEGSVSVVSGRR